MSETSDRCSVDDVIITSGLDRRPSRLPDHEAENRALRLLAETMAAQPDKVLQRLVEAAMELTRSDSAGISLLEAGSADDLFRWVVTTGAFAANLHGTMPREASLCGEVIARNELLLFNEAERVFPALKAVQPRIHENLLAPFQIDGRPAGTLWAIKHTPEGRFEREDARLLQSLARFASAAHHMARALRSEREAGRQSEKLRRIALEGGRMGAWRWNCRSRRVRGDAAFLTLWGLPVSDQPYDISVFIQRMAPDSAAATEAVMTKDIAPSEEFDGMVEIATGPAAGHWVRWRGRAEHERPWIINGVSFDVTDHKRVEERLRESEERLAAELAAMRRLYDLHARIATETSLKAALDKILIAACELTGTDRGCVQLVSDDGKRLEMFAWRGYADDGPFVSHFRYQGFEQGCEVARVERRRLVIEDTRTFPGLEGTEAGRVALADNILAAQSAPMVSRRGETVGVLSTQFSYPHRPSEDQLRLVDLLAWTAADWVERHRAEAALRQSEARFREFAEASSSVLWIRDGATLRFEYVSSAFEAIYGEPIAAAFKDTHLRCWLALIVPEDRKMTLNNLRRVRQGERLTHEFRIRRPSDGTVRWIRNTDFPLLDEKGRVRRIAGLGQDVTAEKVAEAGLRALNEELEHRVEERTAELMAAEATLRQAQKMEAVGQLTSGVAHDFNNMLQAISNSLELLRRRAQQGRLAEAARYIETARETVKRAAALTHRLLAFSRQQKLDPTPVNLDELVVGMTEMIQRTVGSAIQVEVRLSDGRWPVRCDSGQLENALLNLCVNARDAMPNGGWLTIMTDEVQVSAAELEGEADLAPGLYGTVSVTDTGTGMPPEIAARVFEPFYTTKPLGQGTGLGLPQVYGFVRQSGGFVRVETAPGQGTTVRLFLPRHVPDEAAKGETPVASIVLLVEDEEALRGMAAEWLREAGYRVLEASDGAAALRLLHGGGRVDMLVTDVGLPGGLNGRQVAEVARMERPELPVLFITGYAGAALRSALPRGMAVIDKPFQLDDLVARVQSMLEVAAHQTPEAEPQKQ